MSKMNPLVSIIVPAYNCANYVVQTLDSVFAQDYLAKQVIVVNDGSKDHTLEVLKQFADRITLIDQSNAGPAAARNAGLTAATGDYIAFVDADDIWLKRKLTAQVACLTANPEVVAVFTDWQVWRPDGAGRFVLPETWNIPVSDDVNTAASGWLYTRLLLDCVMQTSGVMMRAALRRKLGDFDPTLSSGEDYDFWLRLSREGQITKLASVGVLYRVLPNSVSRSVHSKNFEFQVLQRSLGRWGPSGPDGTRVDQFALERRLDNLQLTHAHSHLHHGNPRIALAVYRDVAARHPTQIKLWLNAARAAMKALRKPKAPVGAV